MRVLKKVLIFVLATIIFCCTITVSVCNVITSAEAAQSPVVFSQSPLITSSINVNGDLSKIQYNDHDTFSEYKIQYVVQLIGAISSLFLGAYAMFLLCKGISVKNNRSYTLGLAAIMFFLTMAWPATISAVAPTPVVSMCGE